MKAKEQLHQRDEDVQEGEQIEEGEQLEEGEEVSENEQSSEFITPRHASRRQLCTICESALYKYTCPRCQAKSCGISCLNKHKRFNNCSGVADPFFNLQSKQIGQKEVEKDYRFVKEMLSGTDKVKRTLTGVDSLSQQPKRFKIMRINAKKLYDITILNAPPIIQRHRDNISFYFVKTKTFYWIVELLYYRSQNQPTRYLTQPEPDSKSVIQLLPQTFLCRDLLVEGINTQKRQEFHIFIERKGKKQIKKQAIEISSSTPLRDALIGHTIYQFPTLRIVHSTLLQKYLSNKLTIDPKATSLL